MKSKITRIILTTIFLALSLSFSNVNAIEATFPDSHGIESAEAIKYLKDEGIVNGFTDGLFHAERQITRAEFLKMVLNGKSFYDPNCLDSKINFPDVPHDFHFFTYICSAVNNDFVHGYQDGYFRPNDPINYIEASKIVSNVEKISVPTDAGPDWFSGFLSAMERERVVPSTIESGDQDLTRGEVAQILWGVRTGYEVENSKRGPLPKLNSCVELSTQMNKYNKRMNQRNRMYMIDGISVDTSATTSEEEKVASAQADGAGDYSTTNIQELGVDEADIVKNDGSHIFMIKDQTVRIIKAYPPEYLSQSSIIRINNDSFRPKEMYLDGNILTIIGSSYPVYDEPLSLTETDMYYPSYQTNSTEVYVYNVSNRSYPRQVRSVIIEGDYTNSRKIGDYVYLVTNKWNYYPEPVALENTDLPKLSDSTHPEENYIARCGDIYYFPNFQEASYMTVSSINTRNVHESIDRETVLGSSHEIYASKQNMYLTRTTWNEILVRDSWYDSQYTEIYKFGLDGNDVNFKTRGTAEGRILNQFAMSEHAGFFRVATQKGNSWGLSNSQSNIYVYDENLNLVGSVEGIAPGENMHSARFMGNRGYLVTFLNIDPFFVVDLSDPYNPKILGELKIPGYSDYLHPYDENHIIGFGKDAIPNNDTYGPDAWYQGVKISMFDVSNINSPREIFSEIIGDRGSETPVIYDHKALLFDKEKNIMAFPITVAEVENKSQVPPNTYGEVIFSGAYVYDIDLNNGFRLRGKVTHFENGFENYLYYNYYGDGRNIDRIVYIGNNFYSISQDMVKALDWNSVTEKNRVNLY
ncbi:copper amine oxidase [Candidatus Dojkabacteria bacterium]|nr:copper amine oxidase [Candidatus Dojkabacteria bacterium]